MIRIVVACALVLTAAHPAAQDDPIRTAAYRLAVLSSRANLSPENVFVHEQAGSLLERWRKAAPGSFLAGRLELATTDLLNASEHILASREPSNTGDASEETRRLIARDLERTYFRIQEGDYFSRQSQEAQAPQYVQIARRLYQLARAAYDDKLYARVRRLSDASREVISALERLAQAGKGVPDPPRLPEI